MEILGNEPGASYKSHSVVSDSLQPLGLYSSWNSPGQNIAVGSLSILQGVFLTQGSNPGLLHCRQILYQLSYKESPLVFSNRTSSPPHPPKGSMSIRAFI